MDEVDDADLVVERVAALDLGKAGLEACAGVYYLLEAEGFDCWLINAREVKNVPGRAKTDRADAVWLAKVAERGMCWPSLVQPPEIRRLRDLTRYRRALEQDRTREQQRMEKLLEDAQIKVSAVLSNLHGVTGRAIMDALIAGERDPRTLAAGQGLARKKTDRLEEPLRGFFTDHHATILQMMLDNSDQIAALDARFEEAIGPFCRPAARFADIPGVSTVAAAELIAEIGVDMTRFPSAVHLVSWASSARRSTSRPVSPSARAAPRATLGWPAPWAASRSSTRVPTPSWAPATGAWPDAAASRRRSSLPAIRY